MSRFPSSSFLTVLSLVSFVPALVSLFSSHILTYLLTLAALVSAQILASAFFTALLASLNSTPLPFFRPQPPDPSSFNPTQSQLTSSPRRRVQKDAIGRSRQSDERARPTAGRKKDPRTSDKRPLRAEDEVWGTRCELSSRGLGRRLYVERADE